MRKIEHGICRMPLRKVPHPEPVEGRTMVLQRSYR
jgi:hypothetical protein